MFAVLHALLFREVELVVEFEADVLVDFKGLDTDLVLVRFCLLVFRVSRSQLGGQSPVQPHPDATRILEHPSRLLLFILLGSPLLFLRAFPAIPVLVVAAAKRTAKLPAAFVTTTIVVVALTAIYKTETVFLNLFKM